MENLIIKHYNGEIFENGEILKVFMFDIETEDEVLPLTGVWYKNSKLIELRDEWLDTIISTATTPKIATETAIETAEKTILNLVRKHRANA